jgi:hypothetical protein
MADVSRQSLQMEQHGESKKDFGVVGDTELGHGQGDYDMARIDKVYK